MFPRMPRIARIKTENIETLSRLAMRVLASSSGKTGGAKRRLPKCSILTVSLCMVASKIFGHVMCNMCSNIDHFLHPFNAGKPRIKLPGIW
jgi:hypothetical protein